jgi:glycosyltransferase involved in cell wall biosynthesis
MELLGNGRSTDPLSGNEEVPKLRVLFVGKAPLSHVGGAEMSTHYLAVALAARSNVVLAATSMKRRSIQGVANLAMAGLTGRVSKHVDARANYGVVTSIRPLQTLSWVEKRFSPDVVVVTGTDPEFAASALEANASLPTVLYVRVEDSIPVALRAHADVVVTNSEFMAGSIQDLGIDAEFLPSVFPIVKYSFSPRREKVLFVNPVPKKGVAIALHLAEHRPDIPFVFSLSWRVKSGTLRQLRKTARSLGNVEIRKATRDPARLYRDCRLLLVPSQCAEAWPRVVSEAQISGTPVLASNMGGIPEAVGLGGVVVDPPDSKTAWVDALSEVWDDPSRYRELAERAFLHSRRAQLSEESIVHRFDTLLRLAIERHSRRL